ncbi:VOC family protein [Mesobacterium pallidum]|uniref:VOC family protein n=1 Tax=Mesobacterium pallidum TaxID=2872037 RepID=UPI001EE15CC0|nr:VOC family protein [Mesobacterium pallidum]
MKDVPEIGVKPVLHHVTFKTTRLDEMLAWYEAVIGCTPNFKFEGGSWTTNDAANHRLAFLQTPKISDDPGKLEHAGLHHTAFEFPSFEDLMANYSRLADGGIVPHICLDHGLTMSFYYVDPDGNSVELQSDNFGDWAKSTEFMRTSEEFAREPIGVEVDPPKMALALAEGVPVKEILVRSRKGEYLPDVPGDIRLPG